jgi:hypothetical protein
MTIYLESFNKESSIANGEVEVTSEYIIKSAKELNIAPENITFKPVSKTSTRNRNQQFQTLEILGYEVSREVMVNFTSLETYTDFSDKLASRNNIERVNTIFGATNESELNQKLVKMACENAKNKASQLAEGLGVKLGRVFAVTQDSDFSDINAAFEIKKYETASFSSMRASEQSKVQIIPKSISFKKSVNVVYKIRE